MDFSYFANTMIAGAVAIFLAGVAATLGVVYGMPWMWHLVKPWLHPVTG